MTMGTRKPGEFCWINMLTPQPEQARAFFGKLLGWTYAELPGGMGHAAQVGGRNIGGLFDLADPRTPKGTPPLIGVVVKVESADAACAKVTSLGGKAKPAFDVMDQGRMAVCNDPNGAQFDVWEPRKGHGTDADSAQHGVPSWFEAMTTDVDRAAKFYTGLFGWAAEAVPMAGCPDTGGSPTYTVFKQGGAPVAGMMQIAPRMGKLQPHWGTYFTVRNADETVREATRLGAQLCVPPQDVPGIGRFCGITSPHGVTFHVFQYARGGGTHDV